MKILGIETSCDETSVAVYDSEAGLLVNELYSQIGIHAAFGGVVPELASRDHIKKLMPLLQKALDKAKLKKADLHGIAYTAGPGLIGALLVGASVAKSFGYALKIPTVGVHHMEAHLLAPMLEKSSPTFPFLALLVSGGHTLLVEAKKFGQYEILGESIDDAAGEAFDKVAKLLGLPYPGGPALAKLAEQGKKDQFHFPRPMIHRSELNFSFSGLKTSVVNIWKTASQDEQTRANIAYAFQEAIVDTLVHKCKDALKQTHLQQLVIAGGVSANRLLRERLQRLAKELKIELFFPRLEFCTDNAAMIAYTGCQKLLAGEKDNLEMNIKARWSLGTNF